MELMDDPAGRGRIGEEGRGHAVRHLNWDAVWKQYANILNDIAQER